MPSEYERKKVDFITLDMALENNVWMMAYAAEPHREIDVRMTYAELVCIFNLISHGVDGSAELLKEVRKEEASK